MEAVGVLEVLAGEWEAAEMARMSLTGEESAPARDDGQGEWVPLAVDEGTRQRLNAVLGAALG